MISFICLLTFYSPADAHGKNQWWKMKRFEVPSARNYLIYADDFPNYNNSVTRFDDWKLIG
jgi:hypothetical protein